MQKDKDIKRLFHRLPTMREWLQHKQGEIKLELETADHGTTRVQVKKQSAARHRDSSPSPSQPEPRRRRDI